MATPNQKKRNFRTGLILATVVFVFFAGFIVRMIYFGSGVR